MAKHTPSRQLFDLLVTKNFNPDLLDASGKSITNPTEAEIFSFDYVTENGKNYGTVVIMLGSEKNLDVFFGDNIGRTMESDDKNQWFSFLHELKHFAVSNLMTFDTKNINRLKYSMQGQATINESLLESWQGKRNVSWNAGANESRLMIKHKRNLGEDEARFRYVESLFIETADGERFKLPFRNLTAGKAMLEHVRNGGLPYDLRGQHIAEMVNELTVLSRFKRANAGKLLEGDTAALVEQATNYFENLKSNLKSLTTRTGYTRYFESWSPAELTEQEVVIEGIKHLFVTQSIDQRIEEALPLIARIQQQENAMKEANIFEAWANRLMEGIWQLPDTPEKQAKLIELLSTDLPVGADATNATEQLYDLIGDDELFDQLLALADKDANADARQVILNRMQQMSDDPDVAAVLTQLTTRPNDSAQPVNESRLMDSAGETIEHVLNRFKHEVKQFERSGELDNDLYEALFDYYSDAGEIPYGIAKARDGDPYEWVAANLQSHLSGGGIVGGMPDEDYGMERESVGDYAEEKNRMRGLAGLPAEELEEFAPLAATVGGVLASSAVSGAGELTRGAATLAGQVAGNAVGTALSDQDEDLDEGSCNMTEAGKSCPQHGLEECGMEESALKGQYGHSGRMKEVNKDVSFLDRLKELSGMNK